LDAGTVVQAARLAKLASRAPVLASGLVRRLIGDECDLRFGGGTRCEPAGLAGRMAVHEVPWG
jgi:class 3 adenylate cyclase